MSCYLVEPQAIQIITSWAEANDCLPPGLDRETTARLLAEFNILSCEYRYPDTQGHVGLEFQNIPDAKYLEVVAQPYTEALPDPYEISRLCRSLDYQCCEPPDWENHFMAHALKHIEHTASNQVIRRPQ